MSVAAYLEVLQMKGGLSNLLKSKKHIVTQNGLSPPEEMSQPATMKLIFK